MHSDSGTPTVRAPGFHVTPLGSVAELIDLLAADLSAIEPGLTLLERGLKIGERGAIDLLARDASGRIVVIDGETRPDHLILRSLDHYLWISEHSPLVARIFSDRAIGLSVFPRLVLLSPEFSRSTRKMASLLWHVPLTLNEYRHVTFGDAHGLLLERVFEGPLDRETSASPVIPANSREDEHAAPPRPMPAAPPSAAAPAKAPANPAAPQAKRGDGASGVAAASPQSPPSDTGARLYPSARDSVLKIDPRIEMVESGDRAEFLFLHKTLVEVRRTPDALWLRVPPAESSMPIRSERDLERELHGVIDKFFRLYLSGRSEPARPESPRDARAEVPDPMTPAKLTEDELREFYRLEGGPS